jgi:RHS repeat-associated protein
MSTIQKLLGGWALGLALLVSGMVHADSVTYVYTDPQGTPLANADVNGNITATFDYAPYGSVALGTAPNGPGYTGHVNDPDTGFVYMQARYYDPSVGRFLSVDPVVPVAGNAFNFSRYAYGNNNPITHTDPDGRCADGSSCDQMVQSYGKWANANPEEADKLGRAVGVPGVMAMASASGLSEVVGLVKTGIAIDKALSDSPSPSPAPKTAGNTNPYEGPIDAPLMVVDRDGNAIPVNTGERMTTSKNGDFQQVRDVNGKENGVRLDRGGHKNQSDPKASAPHAHQPGVTDSTGNPHLPINPPKTAISTEGG